MDEKSNKNTKMHQAVVEFISGYVGGMCGVIIGHPLDTMKVNLQVSHSNESLGHLFHRLIKNDSYKGLFKGMSSPIVGVGALNAITFGAMAFCRENLFKHPDLKLRNAFISGAFAGFSQSFISCPVELVKIRMQLFTKNSLPCPKSPNLFQTFMGILNSEGIIGIYRGIIPTFLRDIPGFSCYFGIYCFIKTHLEQIYGYETEFAVMSQCLFAGGLAGVLSWLPSYHFDTIKTRIQSSHSLKLRSEKSLIAVTRNIIQTDGYRALHRGIAVSLIRAFPVNAVTFAGEEITRKFIENYE